MPQSLSESCVAGTAAAAEASSGDSGSDTLGILVTKGADCVLACLVVPPALRAHVSSPNILPIVESLVCALLG